MPTTAKLIRSHASTHWCWAKNVLSSFTAKKLTGPRSQAIKAHEAEFAEFIARLRNTYAEPAWIQETLPMSFWYHDLPASAAEDVAEETYEFLRTILAPFDDK